MKPILLIAAAITFTQPVLAAGNPWLGTWKLNRDKSAFTGTTYTIVKKGNVYHFDYGAVKFDIADDGKDYPIVPTRTGSLKSTGKDEWLEVLKINGVETERTTIKLSSDGKVETETTTGTRADGTTYKSESSSERISGGPDLAGTWKDTKESSSANDVMVYSDAGPNMLKIDEPISKSSTVYPLDGKPVAETGPRAVPDFTVGYKQLSPTELQYKVFVKGKLQFAGTQTVSADGKVLTDVGALASKPNEKTTAIYEKE